MIGRTRTKTGLGARTSARFAPRAWGERLLGGIDDLLNEPLEERPRVVALPSPRAWLRAMLLLDRRLLVPLCVFAGLFFLCFLRQTDYDWWWHLRVGQDIWQNRALPAVDTYSYTRAGQPFVVHEWLFEVLTYLGYRAFTYRGLIVGMAAIVLATYLLHYLLLRALGVERVLAGALLAVTLILSFMTITLRPHIFNTLFLSIELWCLYLYRAGHRRAVWALPPILLLWVNLHGAWIMGLGTLALFIVGEWLNARARGEAATLRPALGALAASLVATLFNPTGPSLLLYPLTFIGGGQRDDALYPGVAATELPRHDGADLRTLRAAAGCVGSAPSALRLYADPLGGRVHLPRLLGGAAHPALRAGGDPDHRAAAPGPLARPRMARARESRHRPHQLDPARRGGGDDGSNSARACPQLRRMTVATRWTAARKLRLVLS